MKKIIALLLALAMVFCLTACGQKEEPAPAVEPEAPATYQLGLGIANPTATLTQATADADAKVQVNPTAAVILVDEEGKIVACKFDVCQTTATVNAEGVVNKDVDFRSKLQKGDDYGMQKASGLEKGEWYQQVAFLEEYLVGKTAAEVAGIKLDESYYPADEDLRAGCTIHITDFMNAVADAYTRLQDAGTATSIVLGVATDLDSSTDLSAEADGVVFFTDYFAAAALDADGKITAAAFDETQIKFPVTEGGVIGESANYKSKIQLGADYGMQKASSLAEGEWFQQAAFLAEKLVGLDKAGVEAIPMDDATKPTGADILAGCTMKIGHMLHTLESAM